MLHRLKCWPPYFGDMVDGKKTGELRREREDRVFAVGDLLWMDEWDPEIETSTGRAYVFTVTHLLRNAAHFGLRDGFVLMSVRPTTKYEWADTHYAAASDGHSEDCCCIFCVAAGKADRPAAGRGS